MLEQPFFDFYREEALKAKTGLKDLASNVAKALAKKIDKSEMRRSVKEQVQVELGESSTFGLTSGMSHLRHSTTQPFADSCEGSEKLTREIRSIKRDLERVTAGQEEVHREVETFRRSMMEDYHSLRNAVEHRIGGSAGHSDWRAALSEVTIGLRREIADRVSREEMLATRGEVDETMRLYQVKIK